MEFIREKMGSFGRPSDGESGSRESLLYIAVRGFGTFAGGVAIFLGIWACLGIITAQVSCLVAGIWQMLAGFLVIVAESPCCCSFIDFVTVASEKMEKMQTWHRGFMYITLAIPPVFMCFELSTLLGSGLIFITGILYGLLFLGKKGSREDMAAMATPQPGLTSPQGGVPPDQNATLMTDPDVWRPT